MREMKKLLSESQHYILSATFIFSFGAWLGYAYPEWFEQLIAQIMGQIQKVKETIGDNPSPAYLSWVIFINNTRAALLMIGLGIWLFFIPISTLFVNGLAVGYVLQASAGTDIAPATLFIYGILPHGILELPAVVVSGGIGMFFGIRLLRWVFGYRQFLSHLIGSERGHLRSFWQERTLPVLLSRLKGTIFLILLLIAVLALAALIEGFVTPILLGQLMPTP